MRLEHQIGVGRTHPLVVNCKSLLNDKKDFLVKAKELPEILDSNLICEVIGNIIARDLGILTPEAVIIHISTDFMEETNKHIKPDRLIPGYGAGCEWMAPEFPNISSGNSLTDEQLEQAFAIYAFDMFVQNPDRTYGMGRGSNCAFYLHKLMAFDFESSFSFIYDIIPLIDPWVIQVCHQSASHIFYDQLKTAHLENRVDFTSIIKSISSLDIEELAQFMLDMPIKEKKVTDKILVHISTMIDHLEEFHKELYRSLT